MIKVIIVEDRKEFVEILKTFLEFDNEVHVIGVAKNTEEAVKMCLEVDSDLILLDLHLGTTHYDGFEVMKKVNRHDITKNFIVLTSTLNPIVISMSRLFGALRYLQKDGFEYILPTVKEIYRILPTIKASTLLDQKLIQQSIYSELTEASREIFPLWEKGYTIQEISENLNVAYDVARKRVERLKIQLHKYNLY